MKNTITASKIHSPIAPPVSSRNSAKQTKLSDPINRRIDYLRISVTDLCNLRCMYCIPDKVSPKLTHEEILTYEEITRILSVGMELGIEKVRITGGEPLVRRDIGDFINTVGKMKALKDFTITTNGILLRKYLKTMKRAGIKRLNISLDTLTPSLFKRITGVDAFHRVWEGITAALDQGFSPVKLNAVVFKGVNDHEIKDLAGLSMKYPLHVRFIEYMPIGVADLDNVGKILTPEIKARVEEIGPLTPVVRRVNDGPAARFKLPGAKGEVGFISPISRHFCADCNRLRLTASGKFRPCLLSDVEIDVKGPIRKGASDDDIANLYLEAVGTKPKRHTVLDKDHECIETRMSAIGG